MEFSKKYHGIIFDLDGVICSTDQYHYRAWKRMTEEEGIPFDETINNRLRGVSRMESLDIILERCDRSLSADEKLSMAERKNGYYVELLQEMSQLDLTVEVKETLDGLREKGYLLAIGSSSKNTRFILERIGLSGYFDAISDGTNISRSKPDPEVFLTATEYLELSPAVCLVVEDAEAGVEAAYRGGFDSAGLGEASRSSKVTYPLKAFGDLGDIL
jgi:beta-phosphoglucomutase